MRVLHNVTITVFAKPGENEQEVVQAIKEFAPFDIEKEKVSLAVEESEVSQGILKILTLRLVKESHTNAWVKWLQEHVSKEQKARVRSEGDRVHEDEGQWNGFLRFDKDSWVKERKLLLTNSGDCFHVRLCLAVFPKKQEGAIALFQRIFER